MTPLNKGFSKPRRGGNGNCGEHSVQNVKQRTSNTQAQPPHFVQPPNKQTSPTWQADFNTPPCEATNQIEKACANPDRTLRAKPRKAKTKPLYAALDLGTNNCRLLIATPTRPGHFRVIDGFSRIVRLGEGLTHSGLLQQNAMNRTIDALKICSDKLHQKPIRRLRLVATEACRSAENGLQFIQRVRRETGLTLEIVDRKTEAQLAVSGCGSLIEHNANAIVVFDIGGGSSEIALIDISKKRSPRLAEHITAWTSLPVGVVTLTERFESTPIDLEGFEKMKAHVRGLLASFNDRYKLGTLANEPHFYLLGTSGTITTLAGLHLELTRYDRRKVDGIWMSSEEVSETTNRLLSWDLNQRIANPCIGRDRADLVLAGCAILEAIREVWPSEWLRVADRGLREGILLDLMSRDGAWRHRRNISHKYIHSPPTH
ncbi:Ppx/GppA phosphatase family protein [Bartonella sp. DGB2]|uniref:Ppx/GppA phosphatase family protein n=1 Tax=Bartonella sp. DGB2 TaxID=3388426 RepID=UPI00399033A9